MIVFTTTQLKYVTAINVHITFVSEVEKYIFAMLNNTLRWPNTVCARFTDSVSDAIKRALGLW